MDIHAHDARIVGIFPSTFNSRVTTVDVEGCLRNFDFQKLMPLASAKLPGRVAVAVGHVACGASGLVGVGVKDSGEIWVVDSEKLGVVREFGKGGVGGHVGGVTGLEFSGDGRWLLSCGMEGTLRVWDLPTGRLYQVGSWGLLSGG